jgi:Ca2+-binding EF-hand superfamily protein
MMSGQTMAGLMMMQAQPQSPSDLASNLISSLDADGDGKLSLDEIQQALNKAGVGGDITQAFQSLDSDGDGKLSESELTNGHQTAQTHHHAHHGHMAQQIAQDLTSAFDTDGDGSLSIAEINSALGKDSADTSAQSGFAALDTDGDGKLSTAELTAAIQQRIAQAIEAYAQQQQAGVQSVAST